MAKYFQLLAGLHSEHGKKFTAGDIVQSEGDLVKSFGSDKFRKLSDKEVAAMQSDEPATDAQPRRKRVKARRKSA